MKMNETGHTGAMDVVARRENALTEAVSEYLRKMKTPMLCSKCEWKIPLTVTVYAEAENRISITGEQVPEETVKVATDICLSAFNTLQRALKGTRLDLQSVAFTLGYSKDGIVIVGPLDLSTMKVLEADDHTLLNDESVLVERFRTAA